MIDLIFKIGFAYLLGSISGSLLLGKLRKVDIRRYGSGNAGGTNAFRTQGWVFGLGVIVFDVAKGYLAAWWIPTLALGLTTGNVAPAVIVLACALAAVFGHCFPIWHGFRGGKGAATAMGAMIAIEPWLLIPVLITWLVMLLATGYVGLATVFAGFSMVPSAWYLERSDLLVYCVVLALFLLFTHRSNMRNLRNGTEYRFKPAHRFSRKH